MMQPDWHPADIIAALKKRGTSLAAVSRNAGLASSTLTNALNRRWPKGERLIAEALGVAPEKNLAFALPYPRKLLNHLSRSSDGFAVRRAGEGKRSAAVHVHKKPL